jgi:integrase
LQSIITLTKQICVLALYDGQRRNGLIFFSPVFNSATDAVYSSHRELNYHVKKSPSTDAAMQYLRQTLWYRVEFTKMKIERHGQAKILTQQEIELLFNEGLQTARDRTLFGVCLYTACRIAEACSLEVIDIYTARGTVRPTINFRKGNTKGQLQTRTIPVIEDLRSLLTSWKPHAGQTYLFPGRHPSHHWKHLHTNSADQILREAFERIGIEGASTHSFRRTALTSDEQRRNSVADYSRNQRSQ